MIFDPETPLPKLQRGYQKLAFDQTLNASDLKDIDMLYRLFCHAIVTRKPWILNSFVEPRLVRRLHSFCDMLKETGLKI